MLLCQLPFKCTPQLLFGLGHIPLACLQVPSQGTGCAPNLQERACLQGRLMGNQYWININVAKFFITTVCSVTSDKNEGEHHQSSRYCLFCTRRTADTSIFPGIQTCKWALCLRQHRHSGAEQEGTSHRSSTFARTRCARTGESEGMLDLCSKLT